MWQHSAAGCLIVDKKFKLKKGHNSENKNALLIVSLNSMDWSLDGEHILQVSSEYLQ